MADHTMQEPSTNAAAAQPAGPSTATPGNFEISNFKESSAAGSGENLDLLLDIPLEITIELGHTKMLINDLLKLGQGSVIELTKEAGDTLEILANNRLIAKGDVVVVNKKYGIRLTEVISPVERLEKLG
jgi:flagellar motor switch protein FliN/FliY